MLILDGQALDPDQPLLETSEVAACIGIEHATLNSWRVRHNLFGGSEGTTNARYQLSILDACTANLVAKLARHGLPASDAVRSACAQKMAIYMLLQHFDAPSLVAFHRDARDRLVGKVVSRINDDTRSRATVSTRVNLRNIVRAVIDPYGIAIADG